MSMTIQKDKDKKDLYFSTDVETTGLIPVRNSIISLGSCVIRDNEIVDTFSRNIFEQENTIWDGDETVLVLDKGFDSTKTFWSKFPVAYAATRVNPVDVKQAFTDFGSWVRSHTRDDENAIFLAYPCTFDFTWCMVLSNLYCPDYWPFGFAGFCMQAYAAALLDVPFTKARGKNWPKEWTKKTGRHTHIAVEDSVQQAKCFINMRRWQQLRQEKLEYFSQHFNKHVELAGRNIWGENTPYPYNNE